MNNRLIPLPALILVAVIVISGIVSTQSCAASDFAPGVARRSDAGKPAFPLPLIEPTPLKLLLIVTDPVRGCAYGKRGGVLYRSDDRFETAYVIHEFDSIIAGMYVMPNGMLFVSTDDDTHDRAKECRIWRSSDGGGTFVQVKTIVEGCALNWSFASDRENTLYMGEYGPKMPDCSKTVWRTRDYGDTWEASLRLPNVEGIHVHVVAVDPYTDYVWAVNGDIGYDGTWVSEDHGATWKKVRENEAPTSVVFTEDAIWWGEDGDWGTITRYDRATGEYRTAVVASEHGNYGGSVYAMTRGKSGLFYACMVKYSRQPHTPALWAGDGVEWQPVLPVAVPRNEDGGFTTIGGPDRDGWFYVEGYRIRDPERSLSAPARAPQPLYALSNAPNPFNASTVISFTLAENDIPCELNLYSSGGQLVRSLLAARLNCGPHAVLWDGKDTRGRACPSGLYIARLVAGSRTVACKLLLVK
jgi:hypothetical protein